MGMCKVTLTFPIGPGCSLQLMAWGQTEMSKANRFPAENAGEGTQTMGVQSNCSQNLSWFKLKECARQTQSISKPEPCRISEFYHH